MSLYRWGSCCFSDTVSNREISKTKRRCLTYSAIVSRDQGCQVHLCQFEGVRALFADGKQVSSGVPNTRSCLRLCPSLKYLQQGQEVQGLFHDAALDKHVAFGAWSQLRLGPDKANAGQHLAHNLTSHKQPRTLTFQPCAARRIAAKEPTGPAPETTAVPAVEAISTLERRSEWVGCGVLDQDCSQEVSADLLHCREQQAAYKSRGPSPETAVQD